MAVAFDAQASAVVVGSSAASGTSSNLTAGATANCVIGLLTFNGVPTGVGMTWNAVAMALIGSTTASDNTSTSYLFGKLAPTTGNHALAASWGGGTFTFTIDGVSWTGVDQGAAATSFINVVNLQQTPAALTADPNSPLVITTQSGDLAIACCSSGGSPGFANTTTGTFINQDSTNHAYWSGYNPSVGASASIQFGGGFGGLTPCAHVAFDLVATGNAGSNPFSQNMQLVMMSRRRRDPVKTLLLPSRYRRQTRGFALAA